MQYPVEKHWLYDRTQETNYLRLSDGWGGLVESGTEDTYQMDRLCEKVLHHKKSAVCCWSLHIQYKMGLAD